MTLNIVLDQDVLGNASYVKRSDSNCISICKLDIIYHILQILLVLLRYVNKAMTCHIFSC